MRRLIAAFLASFVLTAAIASPQTGPFSAQIQRALRGLTTGGTAFTTLNINTASGALAGGMKANGTALCIFAGDGGCYFIETGGQIQINSASLIFATGGTAHSAIADGGTTGTLLVENNGGTVGVGLDVSTDGIAKFRNRAFNADALIQGIYLSTGSGMAVANVGVNSCGTTAATIAGNNNANVTTVGATSGTQCRIAFTFSATTEWDCVANDDTTTVAVRTTPVDATHTDILGAFTAGDKVTAICFPR